MGIFFTGFTESNRNLAACLANPTTESDLVNQTTNWGVFWHIPATRLPQWKEHVHHCAIAMTLGRKKSNFRLSLKPTFLQPFNSVLQCTLFQLSHMLLIESREKLAQCRLWAKGILLKRVCFRLTWRMWFTGKNFIVYHASAVNFSRDFLKG